MDRTSYAAKQSFDFNIFCERLSSVLYDLRLIIFRIQSNHLRALVPHPMKQLAADYIHKYYIPLINKALCHVCDIANDDRRLSLHTTLM